MIGFRMQLTIEIEREVDGRWIADVREIPAALVYGRTREQAVASVEALALRVIANRIEHGEPTPRLILLP
jgi:predicted RNase H-like HicB family nuclease